MEKVRVSSSAVRAMSYDEKKHILHIWFTSGVQYDYFNVPPSKVKALRKADSIGAYLNKEIKGKYSFRKVSG